MTWENNKRIYGLDFLRMLAIVAVMIHHFPRDENNLVFRAISHFGWVGVDLFFVLSGYLISYFFFQDYLRSGIASVRHFYIKRMFKTLPSYFVMLILITISDLLSNNALPDNYWKYWLIIQNIHNPLFFNISWSLCVEEHFYFFYPWVAKVIFKARASAKKVVFGLLTIMSMMIGVRLLVWLHLRPDLVFKINTDEGNELALVYLYWPTYARLSEFIPGILVALVRTFDQPRWERWQKNSSNIFLLGMVLVSIGLAISYRRLDFLSTLIAYETLAFGFACFVIHALNPNSFFTRWRIPGIPWIAKVSYSLYLTHPYAIGSADRISKHLEFTHYGIAYYSMMILMIVVHASGLFYLIEQPFLKLRKKFL